MGHRRERDKRLTTHCALIARAFGAARFYYTGERDESFEKSAASVAKRWGGKFKVAHSASWRKVFTAARAKGARVVHLTMYGEPFESAALKPPLLLVVGGEKVHWEVYKEADGNASVTNQPHSEAGALAVVMHSLGLKPVFSGAKIRVESNPRGKTVFNARKGKGRR